MKVAIGITEANRLVIATELSKMLADETVLYVKPALCIRKSITT